MVLNISKGNKDFGCEWNTRVTQVKKTIRDGEIVISRSRGRKEEERYGGDSGGRMSNTGGGQSYWRDGTKRRNR
jgi:hypothetical protein